jgi:hypothetical protein
MDGGTVWNTNLVSAVNKCLEVVDSKSKIVVDIAICGHAELPAYNHTDNTIGNFLRYREIKSYYSKLDDIFEYMETEPEV